MRRIASLATASALTCACVVAAGCGSNVTGARKEGPAPTTSVKPRPTTAPGIARHPAALAGMVREDDSVSQEIREDLTPCDGDDYPLDTASGDLTSGDGPDLVVNVTTCGDGLGVATYVYRKVDDKYRHVFSDERAPVYGTVDKGLLLISHEIYTSDDPIAYPIGEEQITYAWRGTSFVQVRREKWNYDAASPSVSPEPTSTDPVPVPSAGLLDPREVFTPTATEPEPEPEPGRHAPSAASGPASAPPRTTGGTAPDTSADTGR